ncbi:MAG: hypothetical protein EYC68_03205 [Chloroflexota bacterium]|nr:MAG: hypothetical protein EYC68_03205 [Chloroflexota bacterium]
MADPSTLADFLRANSYARVPDETRQEEGWGSYKKGYELRIVVKTQDDLKRVRKLLKDVHIKPGKAYRKAQQWVQPIYGKQAVHQLTALKSKKR